MGRFSPPNSESGGTFCPRSGNIAKIANLLRKKHKKKPLLVACDVYRPAAIEQLKQLGRELNIEVYDEGKGNPVEISSNAISYAKENNYDYVLIDCPPSLGLLTINALTAANSVLVPIQCEFYALEGVSQLMNTIKLVQRNLNPALKLEGVLMTMFDQRTNLSSDVVGEVRKYFNTKMYNTIIPRNVRLSEAPSHGQPVIVYDPKSKGAQVYMELAVEVLGDE